MKCSITSNQLTTVRSLFEFNKRVLYQGYVDTGCLIKTDMYTIEDIKRLIFYNKIFISNMDEMFQKYDCRSIHEEYADSMAEYIINMDTIYDWLSITYKCIFNDDCDDISQMVQSFDLLKHTIETDEFDPELFTRPSQLNINNSIVYIGQWGFNNINKSYYYGKVDSHHLLYKSLHPYDDTKYWKAEGILKSFMKYMLRTPGPIPMKITSTDDQQITKIEVAIHKIGHRYPNNKDRVDIDDPEVLSGYDIIRMLRRIIPNTFIIVNPYIFTDDLDMVVDNIMDKKIIQKPRFTPITSRDIFDHDILIEYPNESYDGYMNWLSEVANDEHVDKIFITLYRIGKDLRMFNTLAQAVNNGIKVYVNIELCATGEMINQLYLSKMKEAGIYVSTYGLGTLKVHCKLTLVRFKSGQYIAQIGTGNYNPDTAVQYTDLSLFTADKIICRTISSVFSHMMEYDDSEYISDDTMITRNNARHVLYSLIDREASRGKNGFICVKCNALDDEGVIKHLHKAASCGCRIELIIRGVCTWNGDGIDFPNVSVKSIVWDKLEHSRVYCFGYNSPDIFIGSLDLVTHKLDKRIEVMVKVKDVGIMKRLCDYLNSYIMNTKDAWKMNRLGTYIKL